MAANPSSGCSANNSSSSSSSSHRSALAAGFVAGFSVAAASALSWWWLLLQQHRKKQQEALQREERGETPQQQQQQQQYGKEYRLPPEIRHEQLSRHTLYFGEQGMAALHRARVCVVGVGGVGSHAAHLLARSGLRRLRLIDFDQVTVSSLNRHACAVLQDVGTPKVDCLARFLRQICPDERYLQIETMAEMYTAETGARLLQPLPGVAQEEEEEEEEEGRGDNYWDMVIDCIDDVPTKVALLSHCLQHKIRVISCMGAGGKADPTRLHITDLRSAARDPLATKIRQTLKATMKQVTDDTSYLDDMDQLTILYSSEKTVVKLADFTAEQKQQGVHNYGAVDGMRIRVVPVLGTMPAIMGQALASVCLTTLATTTTADAATGNNNNSISCNRPMQPVTSERVGRNTRHKIYQMLRSREMALMSRVRTEAAALVAAAANESSGGNIATVVVSIEPTSSVDGDGELVTINKTDGTCTTSTTTWIGDLQIDSCDDMEYLLEIWRNRCAVTGARLGTVMHLVRWDRSRTSTCDNLVLISANVLPSFEADPEGYKSKMDAAIRESIEKRLATCRVDR